MTNPFANSEKSPSLSFKDAAPGTVKALTVTDDPRIVQQTVYKSDPPVPAFWPPNRDGTPGKPKNAVVINGLDENGEPASIWCPIPSDLFAKVGAEQLRVSGGDRNWTVGNGDVVKVAFTGTAPSKSGDTKNVYAVQIVRAAAPAAANPFGNGDTASASSAAPWDNAPVSSAPPF